MKQIDWNNWKCRCSAISKILSNGNGDRPISEIQLKRLKELDENRNKFVS